VTIFFLIAFYYELFIFIISFRDTIVRFINGHHAFIILHNFYDSITNTYKLRIKVLGP
jgi:hypothetical protein